MANITFNPIILQDNLSETTKFSQYRKKIQDNMDLIESELNTQLHDVFDQVNNTTTYTQAQMDAIVANLYTKEEIAGAVGNINSPLLDLLLQNSLTMKAGVGSVTFTRSTTATYIDRYGVLKTATVDEPRFEKDGLLIEGSSTNLVTYSEDSTKWYGYHINVVLDSSVLNPYDNLDTPKITGTSDNSAHYLDKIGSITSSSDTYTTSLFIKKGTQDVVRFSSYFTGGTTVTKNVLITFSTETVTTGAKLEKLANGWYRVSLQITDNDSGNDRIRWRIFLNDDERVDTSNDYIYAFGGQIEKMPFVTSYIPTMDSAVTRGADICKIDKYNNFGGWDKPFTIHIKADFSKVTAPKNGNNVLFSNGALLSYINVGSGGGIIARCQSGGTPTIVVDNAYTTKSITFVSDGTNVFLYKNGTYVAQGLVGSNINTGNFINIGSDSANNQNFGDTIKSVKIYDKALTATEVALLG